MRRPCSGRRGCARISEAIEILFHLMLERAGPLPAFVNSAHREDAGQSAALDVVGVDLGQLAGTFLGAGEWRPNRKAIAELRKPPQRPD